MVVLKKKILFGKLENLWIIWWLEFKNISCVFNRLVNVKGRYIDYLKKGFKEKCYKDFKVWIVKVE